MSTLIYQVLAEPIWVWVFSFEVFISWEPSIPVVDCDLFITFFIEPWAFDSTTPDILSMPPGIVGDLVWTFFVVDGF